MKVLNKYAKRLAPVVMAVALVTAVTTPAQAATLTTNSVSPSDARATTAGVTYTLTQSNVTTSAIKCIKVKYDTNAAGTGGKPAGMVVTGATFGAGSNYIPTPASWSVVNDNVNGIVSITYATGETPASAAARTILVAGVTNATTSGSYYAIVSTFNNTDCATAPVDNGVAAFAITDATVVSAIVDPTLTFTVADNASSCNTVAIAGTTSGSPTAVSLGRVTTSNLPFRSQNLVVSTNANSGYTVYARYNGAMTGTAGSIADWSGTNTTPTATWAAGTEAFGYTTSDATLGTGTANRFTNASPKFAAMTTSNAEVSYAAAGPLSNDTNCIGYQMGAAGTTKAGSYSTTVIYTAVPIF